MSQSEDRSATAETARRQNEQSLAEHPVVSEQEWVEQRLALMEKEKQYVRQGDDLAAEVRALPWLRIDKDYTFTSPQGNLTLSDLFQGRSQLFLKHFMMEPGQDWQCEGCTLESNHVDPLLPYFANHDVSYVAVSRAPIEEIEIVRNRMDWKFCWVSSFKSDFNYDFHVSFRPEEVAQGKTMYNFREKKIGPRTFTLSGHSVFYKNPAGQIFRTYGTFGRGGEQFMGIYGFFDVLPKGREEYVNGLVDWAKAGLRPSTPSDQGCGCTQDPTRAYA